MNWEEVRDLLKEAHEEPVAPAHYTAVRARVMTELARQARPWWSRGWAWAVAAGVAVVLVAASVDWNPRVEPLPVVALAYPRAPGVRPGVRKAAPRPRAIREAKATSATLLVRMVTDDPDVVIYWIAESKGDE